MSGIVLSAGVDQLIQPSCQPREVGAATLCRERRHREGRRLVYEPHSQERRSEGSVLGRSGSKAHSLDHSLILCAYYFGRLGVGEHTTQGSPNPGPSPAMFLSSYRTITY